MADWSDGFEEQGYRVTWELTPSQLRQVHALRADVFCRELGWVGAPEDKAEWDEFDATSIHVAVLDKSSDVVAAVRLTGCDAPWMLDTVFSALAPPGLVVKDADAVEASRLLVSQRSRDPRFGNRVRTCDLVYKGAYAYCRTNGIRYVYMVTSDVVLRHLQRTGLPCEPLAPPRRMPDGVRALVVKVDWSQLPRSPSVAAWYESGWRRSRARVHVQPTGGEIIGGQGGWTARSHAEIEACRAAHGAGVHVVG